MSTERLHGFEERLHGFEAKFQHDEELKFRLHARRDRLFGLWVAEKMGQPEMTRAAYAGTYVKDFTLHRDFALEDHALRDLGEAGKLISKAEIHAAMAYAETEALRQINAEQYEIS